MENLLDKITMEEWEMIDTYRQDYVDSSGAIATMAPSKQILQTWLDSKQNLYKLLGNSLIVSDEFNYSKSEEIMERELESLFEGWSTCGREERTGKQFWQAVWLWRDDTFPINKYYSDKRLSEEEFNRNKKIRDGLVCLLQLNNIANNKYTGESFSITLPNGREFKINTGCKVMKTLAKIAEAFKLPGFEDFRICQSYVTNTRMIKAYLTLSIHPLDYMTMSDNDCGWNSCMSWKNEGCYRLGTVEMMNSPYVVIAYISDKNNMSIGGDGEWNNKRWRQLFIVDKDVILGIKSYPYTNDNITEFAMNWLKKLAEQNMGWFYGQEKPFRWSYDDELWASGQSFKFSFYTNFMYNDVGSIEYHYMYYNDTKVMPKDYKINYSGDSQCMWCGSVEELREDSLACDSCSGIVICSDCGERIYEDEVYYIGNDKYCESCYREYMASCEFCDDDFPKREVFNITPYVDDPNNKDKIYTMDDTLTICSDCLSNWLKENIKDPSTIIYENESIFSDESITYFVNISNVTEDGISDLLSYTMREIYNNAKNLEDFITKGQSMRYYSFYSDKRSNFLEISPIELLTKLKKSI